MEFEIPLLPFILVLLAILLMLMAFKMMFTCSCDPSCCCSTARRCSGHCSLGREGEDCRGYCPYMWIDYCSCKYKNCCKALQERVEEEEDNDDKKEK